MRLIYREWALACSCEWNGRLLAWSHELASTPCPACGAYTLVLNDTAPNRAAAVIPDDIPGGLDVPHAICHPDGTPKRYYSKSAIRKAANAAGWTISGETPKVEQTRWI